jgi:hypothetical protein
MLIATPAAFSVGIENLRRPELRERRLKRLDAEVWGERVREPPREHFSG